MEAKAIIRMAVQLLWEKITFWKTIKFLYYNLKLYFLNVLIYFFLLVHWVLGVRGRCRFILMSQTVTCFKTLQVRKILRFCLWFFHVLFEELLHKREFYLFISFCLWLYRSLSISFPFVAVQKSIDWKFLLLQLSSGGICVPLCFAPSALWTTHMFSYCCNCSLV